MTRLPASGHTIALASGLVWGASNLINGVALGMPPFAGATRWLAAPLVAAAIYECMRAFWQLAYIVARRDWSQITPVLHWQKGSWPALWCAILGGPIATSFFFLSIAFAGVTYGVAISSITPALGAVVGTFLLKDRLRLLAWIGVILTVTGAVIVSYQPPDDAPRHFYLGVVFGVLCALGWTFESYFAKKAMAHLAPATVNMVRQAVSGLILALIVVPAIGAFDLLAEACGSASTLVLVAAGLAGAGGYLLYFIAVNMVGPGRALALNLTYVLWTAILGVLLLGEELTWQLGAGVVIIVAGALLVVRGDREAAETAEAHATVE